MNACMKWSGGWRKSENKKNPGSASPWIFYKKTVDKNFNPEKYRIKAIYGENGSGKSAIITAVKIFRELILNHNYLNESKNQIFLEEIINKTTQQFSFSCEFLLNLPSKQVVYRYSVRLRKGDTGMYEIQSEMLQMLFTVSMIKPWKRRILKGINKKLNN